MKEPEPMQKRFGRLRLGAAVVLLLAAASGTAGRGAAAAEPFCPGGTGPDPAVIWCDDFDDGVPVASKYFEYDDDQGDFVPVAGVGVGGSTGMRVVWQAAEVSAGNLKRAFGRSPVRSQSHSSVDFREIYWRQRATILARANWSQAMIAHLWSSDVYLLIDPASGIDASGSLATTGYNDFANLRWLGSRRGRTPVFGAAASGVWHCIEAHVRLNTPGAPDGVFEFWIDGNLEARRADLDWVGTWAEYGINAVFFEN